MKVPINRLSMLCFSAWENVRVGIAPLMKLLFVLIPLGIICWAIYHNSSWNFPEGKWTAISLGNNPWGLKKGMPGKQAVKPFANEKLFFVEFSVTHRNVHYIVEHEGEEFLLIIKIDINGNLRDLETSPYP